MKHKPINSQKTKVSAEIGHKVPCMLAMSMFHDMWHQLVDEQRISNMQWHCEIPDVDPPIRIIFLAAAVKADDAEAIGTATYKTLSEEMITRYGVDIDAIQKTN